MSTHPATDVSRIPGVDHDEAMRITQTEGDRFAAALRRIGPSEWSGPTDCDRWDVHDLVAHVVGSATGQASPREFVRQVIAGRRLLGELGSTQWWDGVNEVHVRERRAATARQLIEEWDVASAAALRARRRLPRLIARLPVLNLPAPVGRQPIAYLFDMGFTRDVWMHRLDLAEATGTHPDLDADHDGRIVADIVAEWARTHGESVTLMLSGPAGGTFQAGSGGAPITVDTTEFMRILTGRATGSGVLRHQLPL